MKSSWIVWGKISVLITIPRNPSIKGSDSSKTRSGIYIEKSTTKSKLTPAGRTKYCKPSERRIRLWFERKTRSTTIWKSFFKCRTMKLTISQNFATCRIRFSTKRWSRKPIEIINNSTRKCSIKGRISSLPRTINQKDRNLSPILFRSREWPIEVNTEKPIVLTQRLLGQM